MCCLSVAIVEAFQCPLSYRNAIRAETVDTISMVGLNSVIFWNKSLVDATDGHAREYFPVGDPRDPKTNVTQTSTRLSRQQAGYERRVVTPTAVEWGGQATPRKLFPATAILGVSETGNQAAYTAAASRCK